MGGLAVAGALTRVGALPAGAFAADSRRHPMLDFAEAEILTAARAANTSVPKLRFELDASLGEQAYRVDRVNNDTLLVTGGDATGAMYGGLDVAEALRFGPAAMARGRPMRWSSMTSCWRR